MVQLLSLQQGRGVAGQAAGTPSEVDECQIIQREFCYDD